MNPIQPGDILKGPFWRENVRVISTKVIGENLLKVEAVGLETNTFYNPILSQEDIQNIEILEEKPYSFSGDAEQLFLYLEANRIKNAFQFDPLYAVNISQIDPLPHQIDAVYYHILQNPRIRFLLADDPGAGKTIMAGLLLKELKYRGLVERALIVVPGHLKDQWLREMKEKFQEHFSIIDRNTMNSEWGVNVFLDKNQVIVSMDFAKQDNVMFALKDTKWDLCIVDEAHKLSAYKYGEKINKTQRYNLGELLSSITTNLLFLTATPHRGDPDNFRLLLDLLEPSFFADTNMLAESIQNKDNPLLLRRLKEDLKDFEGKPIFPPRIVETIKFYLSEDEKNLYNAVTSYVENYFNKALVKDKRNVTFALIILQRRLASSVRAVRKSLERRYDRLTELYKKGQIIQQEGYDEDYLEDLQESERWAKEEEMLEKLTSADSLDELQIEIQELEKIITLAKKAEKQEIETKLTELKKLMEEEQVQEKNVKLLIFTEAKDTLDYLVEKLKGWGYSVTFIHGGMNLDTRIKAEQEFNNMPVQIMVSTEAGGEGINLQKSCWIMVNYDIPWNPNRLEQRMGRIHRYGQQHEVHIYNMVACDTKEGQILIKLFDKLSKIKQNLGSDRVFDVLGEVLVGKSLKDLILEAITNQRTMDDILKDFDATPDEEAIKKVREVTDEALATKHINLSWILGEQRKALENRLNPEYVEQFFERAANILNIKMEKRSDGLWKISSVPFEVRNRSQNFKIKYGEVQREYAKVSFDKQQAFKMQAEFIASGHPLLEAVIEEILVRFRQSAMYGATLIDTDGKKDCVIWFLESEIKDGKNDTAGKRLFAIYQDKNNQLSFINPAVLWDLKTANQNSNTNTLTQQEINLHKDDVLSFVIDEGIEEYKNEILEKRIKDAKIKRKYGLHSINYLIGKSEQKIAELETRRMKGEIIPEVTIQNERRNKEDLKRKKEKLEKEIEEETHLSKTEPKIISAVRVIPAKQRVDMVSDEELEQLGMEVVMEYEINSGRMPEDVSKLNVGYDIRSKDRDGNYRYIEVKARAREGAIALTPNEWLMAQRLQNEYWLYIVLVLDNVPQIYAIQNPFGKIEPDKEINIVRYIVKDWKESAELIK